MLQLVYTPTLPPGCCFICRASIRDSYIDTGVTVDFDGTFYACNQCVREMAEKYGFLSFDEYKDMRSSKEELERQVFELIKRMGELEGIHDALERGGYKLDSTNTVVRVSGYSPTSDEVGEERTSGTKTAVGTRKRKTVEQSNDEGVGELHSDESSSDNSEFSLDL